MHAPRQSSALWIIVLKMEEEEDGVYNLRIDVPKYFSTSTNLLVSYHFVSPAISKPRPLPSVICCHIYNNQKQHCDVWGLCKIAISYIESENVFRFTVD